VILSASLLLTCGTEVNQTTGSGGAGGASSGPTSGAGAGATTTGVGGSSGDWVTLIEGDWTMAPGNEGYVCVGLIVPETMYVNAFRPIAPDGTHHTVLSRTPFVVEGTFGCDVSANGPNMIYGSGVGTQEEQLPDGVAVKLEAGEALVLNLHLFNTTTSELLGTSGVQVKRLDPADVQFEAESVLAGTVAINIPPQSQASAVGHCTLPPGTTIFGVGPHMHQFGTHMKVTVSQASGDTVIHDADYTFDNQAHYPLMPALTTGAGDDVVVECTYDNPTTNQVGFGDSSLDEMCFAGLFFYPATGSTLICDN
jgi:hypothetical protein